MGRGQGYWTAIPCHLSGPSLVPDHNAALPALSDADAVYAEPRAVIRREQSGAILRS